jgi:cis-L-3-hydroxyproline dehydratase
MVTLPGQQSLTYSGTVHVTGTSQGRLLWCDQPFSFWGGVDPTAGEIIDRFHPLRGRHLKDTVFAMPGSKGSCGGSDIILELIMNGLGPKALIFERREEILTLGIIVAEEFFGTNMPVVQLPSEEFRRLAASDGETLYVCENRVSNSPLGHLSPVSGGAALGPQELELSDFDRACLDGTYGESVRLSMSVIARIARVLGSSELMNIRQAHVDGAWYGPHPSPLARS